MELAILATAGPEKLKWVWADWDRTGGMDLRGDFWGEEEVCVAQVEQDACPQCLKAQRGSQGVLVCEGHGASAFVLAKGCWSEPTVTRGTQICWSGATLSNLFL